MNAALVNIAAEILPVLAQLRTATKFKFPKSPSTWGTVVFVFIVIVVLVVVAFHMAKRFFGMLAQPGPHAALFTQLCEVHKLSGAEVRSLRRIAKREKLDNPARLFVEKHHLETYAHDQDAPAYRRLYKKLFTR